MQSNQDIKRHNKNSFQQNVLSLSLKKKNSQKIYAEGKRGQVALLLSFVCAATLRENL